MAVMCGNLTLNSEKILTKMLIMDPTTNPIINPCKLIPPQCVGNFMNDLIIVSTKLPLYLNLIDKYFCYQLSFLPEDTTTQLY